METSLPIMRAAGRLRWAVIIVVALMVSLYAAARLGLRIGGARIEYATHELPGDAGLVGDIGMALLVAAFVRLAQMLAAIASGELFSAKVIRLFRGFAFWLFLMAIVGFAGPLLTGALANRGSDPLRLVLDFRQLLTVGVTLLLFLLARLLERARAIDEEVREFI